MSCILSTAFKISTSDLKIYFQKSKYFKRYNYKSEVLPLTVLYTFLPFLFRHICFLDIVSLDRALPGYLVTITPKLYHSSRSLPHCLPLLPRPPATPTRQRDTQPMAVGVWKQSQLVHNNHLLPAFHPNRVEFA